MLRVLDSENRILAASRAARQGLDGIEEGRPVPGELLGEGRHEPVRVPYEVEGRSEALLYLSPPGELAAYEELRAGFTAAVSHELRTPLARLLALLETASLPGQDAAALVEQARTEVEHIRELIDDILFLSELETGRAVVALGSTRGQIVRLVLRDNLWMMIAGIVIGLPFASRRSRAARALLYGLSPTDGAMVAGATCLLAVAGLCAAAVPAWRAARISLQDAMRSE